MRSSSKISFRNLSLAFDESNPLVRIFLWLALSGGMLFVKFGAHELWKDEWQAWLMARDMDWATLLGSLYYEGHPALWYLYLKCWTLPTVFFGWEDAVVLPLAHSLLVVAAYYLLMVRLSLPLWLKVLILLGYYPLFEYGLVSRGYVLIFLIGLWLALLLRQPAGKGMALAVATFLLCQTEVYGVLIAFGLLVYLFFRGGGLPALRNRHMQQMAGGAVLGLVVFVISVFPRAARDELSSAYLSEPLAGEALLKAFQGTFANTYWLGSVPDTNVFGVSSLGLVLSLVVLVLLPLLFRSSRPVLFAWIAFQVAFFLFAAVVYTGGVRQWGSALLFWIILLQLWQYEGPRLSLDRFLIILSILGFQMYYAIRGMDKEIKYPFSNARETAAFIEEQVPLAVPVVAINKFEAAPVVGYLGRPVYALPDGEAFTYFKWVEKVYLPPEGELKLFAQYKNVGGIVILTPKLLDVGRYPNVQLWRSFNRYSIKGENYFVYTLQR